MTFSEYALGLFPFISFGTTESDYFTELVGNFIKDSAMDACKLLKRRPDTKYRYIKGLRSIQPKDAQYLYDYRDTQKFSEWIWERISESDSYDSVVNWLCGKVTSDSPDVGCAILLEKILLDIISNSSIPSASKDTEIDLALIEEIQEKIKLLPRPANVPVPDVASNDEQTYINELYFAYGDAEEIDSFSDSDLARLPDYSKDLDERRIDFYAAETIRRGVLELGGGSLSNQFDVLKDETFSGVKDTAKRTYANGFERMLSVMEQAVVTPVTNYLLSASPYWISGKIKKGVCHHLVNDGKLVWVKRRKK